MVDFKKGLIDKVQKGQFHTVFMKCDEDKKNSLDFQQFETFCFGLGIKFIVEEYEAEAVSDLFQGNKNNRVKFDDFIEFLDKLAIHEFTPEQYKSDLDVFDEDNNGTAEAQDVVRVLKAYSQMNDQQINSYIKRAFLGPKLTEGQQAATLESLNFEKNFNIKKSSDTLYNN